MPTPALRATRALASVAVVFALVSAAGASEQTQTDPVRQQATSAFRAANPNIHFYTNPEGMLSLYGEPFSYGKSPQDAAAGFLARYAGMFGVRVEELLPQSLLDDKRNTQVLGYDRVTGQYKYTLVYFTQFNSGFPVYNADLRLLVGNTDDFPVINAKSTVRNLADFHVPADATKHLIDFKLARGAAVAAFPGAGFAHFGKAELMVWGGANPADEAFLPALCYVFEAHSADHITPDYAARRFLVDALNLNKDGTARVVYSEDLVHNVDVTGTVSAMATPNANAAACSSLTSRPLPYARVFVGGTPYDADANGNFTIPTPGATPITVDSSVRGKWFQVFESNGTTTEAQSAQATPGVPQNFLFNLSQSEFTTSEVNAYIAANQARDIVIRYNPSFPTVSTAQEFTINVQVSGTCNAFYSGNTINFYAAGGGCNNTGFGTVVHHEFGHNVVAKAGSGQGAFGEGYGDCMGILFTDQAVTGIGFSSCNGGIRTANNTMQYPCSGEVHTCGTLLSGCVWSLRNQLLASDPSTYRDLLGNLVIDSVLLHGNTTSIDPGVTIDFLTADDNDNNINNGTPHYNQINAAFTAHNMPAPPLVYVAFAYPNGRPASVAPATPVSFNLSVSGNIDTPQPDSGLLFYSTGSGYTSVPLTQTSTNNYIVTLPAVACGSNFSYYLACRNTSNAIVTDPPTAPASVYRPSVGIGLADNFNTATGWSVVNTPSGGTFAGQWERATPTGAGQRNDPPTDADGSGMCYLTQNGAPGSNTDVDNGTTVLTSPTIDVANGPVYISYYRWFNTTGNTQDDPFVVDYSLNNGGAWTNLETVGPTGAGTSGGWILQSFTLPNGSSQFRIRFTVSDVGAASLVEAGVDGVTVLTCSSTCPVDFDQTGVVNPADVSAFVSAWFSGLETGFLTADFDHNGFLQPADVSTFVTAWFDAVANGC